MRPCGWCGADLDVVGGMKNGDQFCDLSHKQNYYADVEEDTFEEDHEPIDLGEEST